jgi:hypothetical protein
MFRITASQMENIFTKFEQDVDANIAKMRLTGMSNEQIFDRLTENAKGSMDLFGTFKGAVEKQIDEILGTTAQLESNDFNLEENLKWELDPTVIEHCETCLTNADMTPRTFEQWEMIGLPGMGNTDCTIYCKCTLTRTN